MGHRTTDRVIGAAMAIACSLTTGEAQNLIFSDGFESGDTSAWTRTCTTEICGDGRDNDCDGIIDNPSICHPGVWVSALTGDDILGTGALEDPFATIDAGISLAFTLGPNANVYVAEGVYSEKVAMVEGVSLCGGYQCDGVECTWDHNPPIHDSTISNVDGEGVLAGATITRQTHLDGFNIQSISGTPPPQGNFAAVTIDQGSPTVTNNRLYGGDLSGCTWCRTNTVLISSPSINPSGPLLESNYVQAGDVSGQGFSIGVRLYSGGPTVNVAEIRGNTVYGGEASYTRGIESTGSSPDMIIEANHVFAGSTPLGASGSSFAITINGEGTVNGNFINTDPAEVGACPVSTFWCGGIEVVAASGPITNNVAFGMPAPKSAAVLLWDGEIPFGDIVVNGNTLDGGGVPSGTLSSAIACQAFRQATTSPVGRIRNNILLGGIGGTRFGMYEEATMGSFCSPEAFDNNDIHAADVLYRHWDGSAFITLTTTAVINGLPWADANISVDPMLDSTFHLQGGSQCIDAGTLTEAPPVDFDGDPRPLGLGIDIGADEAE